MTEIKPAEFMTDDEAEVFAGKLEKFEAGLTPKERKVFQSVLRQVGPLDSVMDSTDEAILWAGDA